MAIGWAAFSLSMNRNRLTVSPSRRRPRLFLGSPSLAAARGPRDVADAVPRARLSSARPCGVQRPGPPGAPNGEAFPRHSPARETALSACDCLLESAAPLQPGTPGSRGDDLLPRELLSAGIVSPVFRCPRKRGNFK